MVHCSKFVVLFQRFSSSFTVSSPKYSLPSRTVQFLPGTKEFHPAIGVCFFALYPSVLPIDRPLGLTYDFVSNASLTLKVGNAPRDLFLKSRQGTAGTAWFSTLICGLHTSLLCLIGILKSVSMNLSPLFLVSLILLQTQSLSAQNATSGGLTGVVTDPSNAVVPDAKVELRDNAKGIRQTKTTNPNGEYFFSFVAPGNYTLTVTHSGFRTISQNLDVNLGPPAR